MILDEIAAKRSIRLKEQKSALPLEAVQRAARQAPEPRNFRAALQKNGLSVIAEVKRASPSKGVIRAEFDPAEVAKAYEAAGADAVSVLTEEDYFQGSSEFLREVRSAVSLPVLRKDFILDPYQIYEARALGADAVLLIAALLDENTLREFGRLARSLGLSVLTEAHSGEELSAALRSGADLVGVNNRDLKTFRVDLGITARLAPLVPRGVVLVSESGVRSRADAKLLREAGADAVLVGETLMRSADVGETLRGLREGL